MSKSNGCDSNGQNEMEGTGGQRGRGQARSKADRLKTKQNETKRNSSEEVRDGPVGKSTCCSLSQDPSLVASTDVGWLTTACNQAPGNLMSSSGL